MDKVIEDNEKYFNRLHIVIDVVIIALSYLLAWYFRFQSGIFYWEWSLSFRMYMSALTYVIPAYLILYSVFGVYASNTSKNARGTFTGVLKANIAGLLCFILVLYLLKQEHFSRTMLFIFFCINIVFECVVRYAIRQALRTSRINGHNLKYILLVGYSRAAEEYIDRVKQNPQWGYVIRGILDDNKERGTEYRGIRVIGEVDNLFIILPQNRLDEIAITLGLSEYGKLAHIVGLCEKSGVHTMFIPDYTSIIPTKPYTEDLMGLPVINIRHVPLNNPFNKLAKRIVDIIGSLIAIVIFSPLMIICAIIIKLTSPGPLIFKQERVGLHNKTFRMYKFRSMVVQESGDEKKGWTVKGDPRVTPIGRFIRKTSIDEMPQFFNVLAGSMSLIGPRPERPQFVDKFKEEIPRYMIKHQVRPGLTGWAQVNGYRGDTSIRKRIDCDLYYIENWTMGFDFKILFLTFFKGFINKNAY